VEFQKDKLGTVWQKFWILTYLQVIKDGKRKKSILYRHFVPKIVISFNRLVVAKNAQGSRQRYERNAKHHAPE
jgi:hypothetical protein